MSSDNQPWAVSTASESPQASRKRKRHTERERVTRACDRCKKRKIKCNGTQPCEHCVRAEDDCTFTSAYSRGRAPVIPRAPEAAAGSDATSTGHVAPRLAQHAPEFGGNHIAPNYLDPPSASYPATSRRASPEPSQTDLQGHYIGPASGVSFLLRVQKRLHQAISFSDDSTIFTFGDAPLEAPEFDPSFCMMLPRNDAQRLVDRYFDFAMPTYRFLHRPTVQEWFDEFYDTFGAMRDAHAAPARVALLFMVLALARLYMPDNERPGPSDLSARYFLAAEHQLNKERGSIRLTSVQARLTQCYYLLARSRINHCWSLFGTVSRLALAIGLNRNRQPNPAGGLSVVEVECRRRTFWCAYTLDTYLSVALGRPRSFHDDDIDTEFPACVDDEMLTADHIANPTPDRGQSTMLAPLAHIKLARIMCKILRDLYSIKPISASRRSILTERISKELSDWRVELARFLDLDVFSTSLLVPLFQRQRNVLNLTYWHAIILTYRPLVLADFARLSQQGERSDNDGAQMEESMRQCLTAAMNTVNTIEDITQTRQMFRAFWITAYFAFTAIIILYMYAIQKRASPPETYASYISAAAKCQARISSMAEKGSLPERYCLVLEELRQEALRQARLMHPTMTGLDDGQLPGVGFGTMAAMGMDDTPSNASQMDLLGETAIDFNGMPSSAFSGVLGWGQFASMVSSGLGNFDSFPNEETF